MKAGDSAGVSIVIPAYNYAAYVSDAVKSCLRQSHPLVEVLVVNDGSTDNTLEILNKFGDKIQVITQPNAGLSAARNTGIREASHEFLVFLDADDLLEQNAIDLFLRHAVKLPVNFGVLGCNARPINADAAIDCTSQSRHDVMADAATLNPPRHWLLKDLVMKCRFSPTVLVRKEVFKECGGFDTDLHASEDRDMWIRIGSKFAVFQTSEVLVLKRDHGTNMSRQAARQSLNMRKVLRKTFAAAPIPRWNLYFWSKVYAYYQYQSALMFRDSGARAQAIAKIVLSILVCPFFTNPGNVGRPPCFRIRQLLSTLKTSSPING